MHPNIPLINSAACTRMSSLRGSIAAICRPILPDVSGTGGVTQTCQNLIYLSHKLNLDHSPSCCSRRLNFDQAISIINSTDPLPNLQEAKSKPNELGKKKLTRPTFPRQFTTTGVNTPNLPVKRKRLKNPTADNK